MKNPMLSMIVGATAFGLAMGLGYGGFTLLTASEQPQLPVHGRIWVIDENAPQRQFDAQPQDQINVIHTTRVACEDSGGTYKIDYPTDVCLDVDF